MPRFTAVLVAIVVLSCTPNQPESSVNEDFNKFIETFTTSSGNTIDDLSAGSYRDQIKNLQAQLDALSAIDTSQLSFENKIDWRFAQSILSGKHMRLSEHQSWTKDPRIYTQFRPLANILGKPGNINDKIAELEERLKMLPLQLSNGQNQLEVFVPRFQELGLFMARNAIGLFENELPEFAQNNQADNLQPLIADASTALATFIDFLENQLPGRTRGDFAMGVANYNRMLKEELLLDYNDQTLWEFGNQKFNETVAELEAIAREIDPGKTWRELAIEIKNEYPDPYEMIPAHQLWVDSAKSHILANNLIPIPWNERVNVVPRAEYLRKTSYYGNFSRARGKDADSIFTAQWMINPFEDQWDDKTKSEYLVEHDWGVIIVTAPHEAYGGHHIQGLYQLHNTRKIRRENGLSLFSEGWGLYNEQLMRETGFFPTKRIELRGLQLRLWRNARVIYDVGLHTGKMTYEEAISLMTDKVGFLRWAAQLEVDAASARPGYFIGYFMGMTEILKMREKYKVRMGNQFTLSDFHERLLKIGNMPPKLMEESLLNF